LNLFCYDCGMRKMLQGKSKATPKTIKIILDAIRSGASQRDASALAGISEDTLSLWKKQDSDFSEEMRKKDIQCKMDHIKIVLRAAEKTWQAAAWWLERRYANEYTNRVRIEQPEPVRTGFEHFTDEELEANLKSLHQEAGLVAITDLEKLGYVRKPLLPESLKVGR